MVCGAVRGIQSVRLPCPANEHVCCQHEPPPMLAAYVTMLHSRLARHSALHAARLVEPPAGQGQRVLWAGQISYRM